MVNVEVINDFEKVGLLLIYKVFMIIVIKGSYVSGEIGLNSWISGLIVV